MILVCGLFGAGFNFVQADETLALGFDDVSFSMTL